MTGRRAAPLLVALGAFALAVARPSSDPDMFWHLASGRWMVEHRDLLRVDQFSSTVSGARYSVGEWLGEIVLYGAYAAAGWPGLALLRGALVAVAAFFVTRSAVGTGARLLIAVPLATLAMLLSTIVWTDRPHLFTLALFPLLLDLLLRARTGDLRPLIAVPPLLLVWTDLHGGYALGLALVMLFAVEAAVTRRRVVPFTAAAVLAAAATLLDPGSLGIGAAFAHAAAPPRFIVEETPPDVLTAPGFLFAFFVLGTLGVAMRAGGTLIDALVIVPLLWLGLSAQRDMPYFAMAAVPFLARQAAAAWSTLERVPRAHAPRGTLAGLAVGTVAIAVLNLTSLPGAPDERAYPSGALAELRQGTGVLLNEYDWGGYLIWRAPERRVFIDGRLFPYLPTVFADWNAAVRLAPRWREVLESYRVNAVLLRPDRPLVGALRESGWRETAGREWVLLTRP
ncbi:MAG TPA: hypothetical protein VFV20_04475 [Candidatus Limnocylindria bacterium]|nr:hypothetical protein [Candidatus Limnocylindria bacterium]